MPESFGTLLAEIAETAGSAANPAGPVAARERGYQRLVRQRFAASVLSVVLFGGAGGIALALAVSHAGMPAPSTHSGTASGPDRSGTPTTPDGSADASPSPGGGKPSAVTGDLNTIVTRAWYLMTQFEPFGLAWKTSMDQPAIHKDDRPWFYSCYSSGTLVHLGASGYQELSYSATSPQTNGAESADSVMFFFTSTSAAQQALSTIQGDYAHCSEQTTGTDGAALSGSVRLAEELDGSYSWLHTYRTANGTAAKPADIPADNHEFFIQRGDAVEMVRFGGDTAITNQGGDLGLLNDLNAGMCVYGGLCPAVAEPLTVNIISSTGSTSLALGGAPLEVGVTVTNNSHGTLRKIAPVVSLGHCTCINTPLPMMPDGSLQLWQEPSGSWETLSYNREGGGMDYLLSSGAIQVPMFDLPAGESVSFNYRVQLNPVSKQPKLTAPYHLSNGESAIDVTMIHPGTTAGPDPFPNAAIGIFPGVSLPVTVTVN